MTVYEYLTQAYSGKEGERGALSRELMRLAEKEEGVKDIRTFGDLVMLADKMNSDAFRAVTDTLYCEACTACGLSPI